MESGFSLFCGFRPGCPGPGKSPLRDLLAAGLLLSIVGPTVVWAAGEEGQPQFGPIFFGLAVLVVAAKAGGLLAERYGQASVLGELLVGIGLGNLLPPIFGEQGIAFVRSNPTLRVLAEIGVLVLLFDVGLESDLRAFARVGLSSALVALIGVLVPFVLGWGAAAWFLPASPPLVHVFIGATLTATSVGITVRVLKDLGVSRSQEGQVIVGAAILDDVLGLMVLAVVSGAVTAVVEGGSGISAFAVAGIVVKAALFFGVTIAVGHFFSASIVRLAARTGQHGMLLVFGLALCFTLAFVAEVVGLADVVGAFAAGLLLDPYGEGVRTREEEATLSELLYPLSSFFVPLFFVLVGIQVHLPSLMDTGALGFGMILILCAITGKLACALGVVGRGVDRLSVAIGMVPRGEVGLIFAGIGTSLALQGRPILAQDVFSAVVLMVLVTTLITPVGLRWAFNRTTRAQRHAKG
ncbi:MAG: cation:proton antiporter [Deltaproteobacteria bacterium]|nr:cation:proton antiporter [Deltaproteobacteria bacterium]